LSCVFIQFNYDHLNTIFFTRKLLWGQTDFVKTFERKGKVFAKNMSETDNDEADRNDLCKHEGWTDIKEKKRGTTDVLLLVSYFCS
jgi:hypothetical protein